VLISGVSSNCRPGRGVSAVNETRLSNFLERDDGNRVGIVRFLRIGSARLHKSWFETSRHWIEDAGGRRIYAGDLDVVYGRSFLSFERLVIEEYPSREAAINVMARSESNLAMGLHDSFVMAVAPDSKLYHRLIALVGRTIRLLWPVRVSAVREVDYPKNVPLEGLSSDQAQISTFYRADQWAPFTMVNLNDFKSRSGSRDSGENRASSSDEAYERYSRRAAIEVFRRGGNFFWVATPVAVLVGDSDHPLARQWSQFVLVSWPSRMAFRHMIADQGFSRDAKQGQSAISRTVAIPGTPLEGFDSYSI